MGHRSVFIRTSALVLSFLTLIVTAPFSLAETVAVLPLGTITTQGSVTVGNAAAPTGTTIFAGDQVTSSQPALINFGGGSRIEMTKAAATFNRQGKTLVVQAKHGLLRFNFQKGEHVQIDTGKYQFAAINESGHIGELGLNRNGQMVMNLTEGVFSALNTKTGERSEVTPNRPLVVMTQSGQGQLAKGGKSLTDMSKIYQTNELKGMCMVGGSEAYRIVGNTSSVVMIDGSWKMNNGVYDYKVVECTEQAMKSAGASQEAATATAKGARVSSGAAGVSSHLTAIVVAGAAAGAGLGIGLYEGTKSSSSR